MLNNHLDGAILRLNHALVTIRYSIKVQRLNLASAEVQVQQTIELANQLKEQVSADGIRELDAFQSKLIHPLGLLRGQEQKLYTEVQKALQKRPPEGSEIRLINLLQAPRAGQQTDLRGLIIGLIEQSEEDVDLDKLMADLKSLFQKNQISIHIDLLSSNESDHD